MIFKKNRGLNINSEQIVMNIIIQSCRERRDEHEDLSKANGSDFTSDHELLQKSSSAIGKKHGVQVSLI
ncbi:PTS system N,N'-diacetylchitobiose-specific transporter subunit IIA [Clostridium puniceum]|uniref:PTS system N,N'-diacetylchitobiose-specific transporter subunit IIA n=1 Tax=Clostridium puniceum TaxID=29367 RepID=A0A1S8TB92_9CLOT|nr:PTS lactose/cellobiose transporter subunit IIA [Clostridium puniceum]OOM74884.1 PTS system N,N'-diacetylchitobiose-specific transporter subunit IIA [Clostridium puniceum]